MAEWSFLTNHARALVCIAHDPGVRLRDIATTLDITERSAYSIVADLTAGGYVVKDKDGRRNRYQIQPHLPLPEAITEERTIGEVLDVLVESKPPRHHDDEPTGERDASTPHAIDTARRSPRNRVSLVVGVSATRGARRSAVLGGHRAHGGCRGGKGWDGGTVVVFPDLGVTPGLGRTAVWSVASGRLDAVS